jgi:hypothetical protein
MVRARGRRTTLSARSVEIPASLAPQEASAALVLASNQTQSGRKALWRGSLESQQGVPCTAARSGRRTALIGRKGSGAYWWCRHLKPVVSQIDNLIPRRMRSYRSVGHLRRACRQAWHTRRYEVLTLEPRTAAKPAGPSAVWLHQGDLHGGH